MTLFQVPGPTPWPWSLVAENGRIVQVADRGVVNDRVGVIEMEAVVKVVRVGRDESQQQHRSANSGMIFTQRSDHQAIVSSAVR